MVAAAHDDRPPAAVLITVTRSGGFAGVRRTWYVESDESDGWPPLVEACPWREEPDPSGADRFVWHIEVRAPAPAREARLPEEAVQGPWRELVDRVRERGEPASTAPVSPREDSDG